MCSTLESTTSKLTVGVCSICDNIVIMCWHSPMWQCSDVLALTCVTMWRGDLWTHTVVTVQRLPVNADKCKYKLMLPVNIVNIITTQRGTAVLLTDITYTETNQGLMIHVITLCQSRFQTYCFHVHLKHCHVTTKTCDLTTLCCTVTLPQTCDLTVNSLQMCDLKRVSSPHYVALSCHYKHVTSQSHYVARSLQTCDLKRVTLLHNVALSSHYKHDSAI